MWALLPAVLPAVLPAALAAFLVVGGCQDGVEERVRHRSSCLVCHQPLNEEGEPEGIADAHPWHPLSCTDCHGGNAWVCDGTMSPAATEDADPTCEGSWVYDQTRAHVGPAGGPTFIKDLTPGQLDDQSKDYVRFVNPGDFRVVRETCGRCHTTTTARAQRSTMTHTAGELMIARYRAGKQKRPLAQFGAVDVRDPNAATAGPCGAGTISAFEPLSLDPTGADPLTAPTVANAQDQLLVKRCIGCHLSSFGANDAPGRYRSSGCTACHMPYADDGLSKGGDPYISKQTPTHPIKHQLVTAPPSETCMHCHYDGGRIGLSYRGWRERTDADPVDAPFETLGRPLYGLGANDIIVDEDTTNGFDETPPDVHFEAGMGCVDCHVGSELHGDGHLYGETTCATVITCEDCHGTASSYASPPPTLRHVDGTAGQLVLATKVSGKTLPIPQVKDAVTPGHPRYSEHAVLAKGTGGEASFSHSEVVACQTCHSGWAPSCYGCHVEVDIARSAPYLTSGITLPGEPSVTRRGPLRTQDLVLMWNASGRLGLSLPERLLMRVVNGDRELTPEQPRTFETSTGRVMAGFGQRTWDPHTTRRRGPFMACDRCHSVGDTAAPDNAALLDLTYGLGSERFALELCDVTNADQTCGDGDRMTYRLDATVRSDGAPLVVVGHEVPDRSRPLSLEDMERMRAVSVPAQGPIIRTAIPAGATSNPAWPAAQDLTE